MPTGIVNDVFGIQMIGNTLLQWGTDEQKRHYLPRILSGEDVWCQGYSEPNAGSRPRQPRLPGRARRRRVGDQRPEDLDVGRPPRQLDLRAVPAPTPTRRSTRASRSCSCPMDQPGVEVRPIKMITGESEFNEVFFTDAALPEGERGRRGQQRLGRGHDAARLRARRGGGHVPDPVPHRARSCSSRWPRSAVVADDPVVRQRLAWCHSKVEIMRYLGMRTLTQFLAGKHPGPDAAIFKLYWSEYHRMVTELAVDILGADAMVPGGRGRNTSFQTDDAGAPNDSASFVGDVPQRPRRHDLRRHVPGPAQHPRRDGARPAEGAEGRPRLVEGRAESLTVARPSVAVSGAATAVVDGGHAGARSGAAGLVAAVPVPSAAGPRLPAVPARDAVRRPEPPSRSGRRRRLPRVVPAGTCRRRFSVNR